MAKARRINKVEVIITGSVTLEDICEKVAEAVYVRADAVVVMATGASAREDQTDYHIAAKGNALACERLVDLAAREMLGTMPPDSGEAE